MFLNQSSKGSGLAGLLWLCLILLAPSTALADFHWDIPEKNARAVVGRLPPGSIVLTYCPGCEGFYSVFRVKRAVVEKGGYSEDKQVLVEREILLSGRSLDRSGLVFSPDSQCGGMPQDWCADFIEACPSAYQFISIPYSYYRRPGSGEWHWLYEDLNTKHETPPAALYLREPDIQRIEICAEEHYEVPAEASRP